MTLQELPLFRTDRQMATDLFFSGALGGGAAGHLLL
jgi:hypothetical protein